MIVPLETVATCMHTGVARVLSVCNSYKLGMQAFSNKILRPFPLAGAVGGIICCNSSNLIATSCPRSSSYGLEGQGEL